MSDGIPEAADPHHLDSGFQTSASRVATSDRAPLLQSTADPPHARWRRPKPWRIGPHGWLTRLALLLLLINVGMLLYDELMSSSLQARYLSRLGRQIGYSLQRGPVPTDAIRYPGTGPYDERLGYTQLSEFLHALQASGEYAIQSQARMSPAMIKLMDYGLYAIYPEKVQAGLRILDSHGNEVFAAQYPQRVYGSYAAIPATMVAALLFIEDRDLLDFSHPMRNPAVEWDRFARAVGELAVGKVVEHDRRTPGGSTLATQIEKYRHSSEGLTASAPDKLRQMISASLRTYQGGQDTRAYRRKVVLDYINTVPLSARAGYGEVHGIGDGLHVWYGRDLSDVTQALGSLDRGKVMQDQALAYKQVLSLFIAQRRPSFYLNGDPQRLNFLTDVYLDLLLKERVITPSLCRAAKGVRLAFTKQSPVVVTSFAASKANNAVRSRLASLLGLPRLYDLDHLDLTVQSTLDGPTQTAVTRILRELRNPDTARLAGLYGEHLLGSEDDLSKIIYSFTLSEVTPGGNLVRVQTDNYDQPFDINEGVKLDLGSTAKLRTLISYLNIIAALHTRYGHLPQDALNKVAVEDNDALTHWALNYLEENKNPDLRTMLDAAMERHYSADPNESFFTGGGVHTFVNFNKEDDSRTPTVAEGLQNSINLVFIRLMRDVERYHMLNAPGSTARMLEDSKDERRPVYLARFADREGSEFIRRYYRKYQGKSPDEALDLLLGGVYPTPQRLATIYNSVQTQSNLKDFSQFMRLRLPNASFSDKELSHLYQTYSPLRYSLPDLGYIARIHPLELWVVGYLRTHPPATLHEVLDASKDQRQQVYNWLFKTRRKNAQDIRIRTLLEIEAFQDIHREWQQLGYPFDSLVPSYATAIGSSADRPSALAELMSIIINNGVRLPSIHIENLHFASATPYETIVVHCPPSGERVLAPEIAQVVRQALLRVVEQGTARRLQHPFSTADGTWIPVGGKTGTGDDRFDIYGRGGGLLQTRVVDRTAVFVFYIGDRFVGTITSYVPGAQAANYTFTSALPVQILRTLAGVLSPLVSKPDAQTKLVAAYTGYPARSSKAPLSSAPASQTVMPMPVAQTNACCIPPPSGGL